jgi:hypothetical protein
MKMKIFRIFPKIANFQLIFVPHHQIAHIVKQEHFYWNFFKDEISPLKKIRKQCFWSLNITILQLVEIETPSF